MASLATAWVDIVPRFKDLSSTFNRELKGIDATGAGSRLGSQLGDGMTIGAKTGGTKLSDMLTGVTKSAVTGFGKIGKVGLGAITTIGGGITALAAKGGFARALNIENAQAKLKVWAIPPRRSARSWRTRILRLRAPPTGWTKQLPWPQPPWLPVSSRASS